MNTQCVTWTTPEYWHGGRTSWNKVYIQFILHTDLKKNSDEENRTRGLNEWSHLRSTMYRAVRVWTDDVWQNYYFLTKSKERQHRTTLTTRGGKGGREVMGRIVGGGGRGMYDMCMCAKLYKYHSKSMILQRLLSSIGSGRWALVLGAGFGWCCYF